MEDLSMIVTHERGAADGKLFVTSALSPKDGSRLMRLNAGTLAVEEEATLPKDNKG